MQDLSTNFMKEKSFISGLQLLSERGKERILSKEGNRFAFITSLLLLSGNPKKEFCS
jgi:hypothetical protein